MLFNQRIDSQSRIQGLQEKMVCLVCIHGRGVYLQSGMEYLGTDSRAKQSRFRMDRFQHSPAHFMGCDRSSCRFGPIDLADGFKRFVLKPSVGKAKTSQLRVTISIIENLVSTSVVRASKRFF